MEIIEAQVLSNKSITANGVITVYAKGVSQSEFEVSYTSPYSAPYNGGFFAIPEEGSFVLITRASNSSRWYFLSCIHSNLGQKPEGRDRTDLRDSLIPQSVYQARGIKPQQIIFKDPVGNYLKLSHLKSPSQISTKAELGSSHGKRLILSDSPLADAVILKNEFGDRIKINSTPNGMSSGRSIDLDAKGPVNVISREGDVEVLVVDGREITLENGSTGFNDSGWNEESRKMFGNINLRSKWKDLNLTTLGPDGKIFIRVKGQSGLVQINSDGEIVIYSQGNISVNSGGSINIEATTELNLKGGTVNIAGDSIKLSSQGSDINMDSNLALKGNILDLNPLTPLQRAEDPNITPTTENRYGD